MSIFSRKKKEEKKEEEPKKETARETVPAGEGEITTPAALASPSRERSGPAVKLPKGEDAHSYQIVLKPIITEKGGLLERYGQYLFKVAKDANKVEIKKAVEKLYKVRVDRVNVISVPSKFRRVGEHEGKKPGFKKAIVTLKKGDKIEIAK